MDTTKLTFSDKEKKQLLKKRSTREKLSPFNQRLQRLYSLSRLTIFWLLAQGLVLLLLNAWLARFLQLRFHPVSFPLIKTLAVALLGLGVFLLGSLKEPHQQTRTVDILILTLTGMISMTLLSFHFTPQIFTGEWIICCVNLIAVCCLIILRTKAREENYLKNTLNSLDTETQFKILSEDLPYVYTPLGPVILGKNNLEEVKKMEQALEIARQARRLKLSNRPLPPKKKIKQDKKFVRNYKSSVLPVLEDPKT
jgi:hypothetical protein